MIINAVNLVNVRLYGETEFWFALIKVLAIIGMIGFGVWMLFSGNGGEHASIDNLWRYNGFCYRLERINPVAGGDYVLLWRAGAYRNYCRRSAGSAEKYSKGGKLWCTVFCCFTSVLWWCCWRCTRGWK